jgi:poly-beta-1,6-N-acetyl-D-glucosamine synthase
MERYALMTAAHNEVGFIGQTIESVLAQTILPVIWVIVSDRSTDGTDEIVASYCREHSFLRLIRLDENVGRGTIAKVNALTAAYKEIQHYSHDFIGNLDADVTFGPTYFEDLIRCFRYQRSLGIAGGMICERQDGEFRPRLSNSVTSVAHAAQIVRRECYEQIGGYIALEFGGEDWYAEIRARRKGWEARSFPELQVMHHRFTGGSDSIFKPRFREGRMDFSVGSHPLFELIKCARRIPERPFLIGAMARLTGFFACYFDKSPRLVSPEIVDFLQEEQIGRIRRLLPRSDSYSGTSS